MSGRLSCCKEMTIDDAVNKAVEAVEENVIRMIRRGKSDEEIAEDTGCAPERIAELRNGRMAMA